MSAPVRRLRMFAGPNGSGKSTIKSLLKPELIGIYINPDDIQAAIEATDQIDVRNFGLNTFVMSPRDYLLNSPLIARANLTAACRTVTVRGSVIRVPNDVTKPAYLASVLADLIRRELLHKGLTFTFETVMSSADKIELLTEARSSGYRTYLYYIATEDPEINISRVRNRVRLGGHDVPSDKVVSRYHRSLSLLTEAIRQTDRAYIFDNSGTRLLWVAEITDGRRIELKADSLPAWFRRHVWDQSRP